MSNKRHRVAHVNEFDQEPARILIEIKGSEIAVFRHKNEFYALANFCPHQSGPLCEGHMSGVTTVGDDEWSWEYDTDDERYITCPWHYWKFDITTGENAHDKRYKVPKYETVVDDDIVYVVR